MSADKYLAICESGDRTCRMFRVLYPKLAMAFGSDPDFKRLVLAVTDLRMDLPKHTTNQLVLVDEPCLEPTDE
jgi:hypothetical protein